MHRTTSRFFTGIAFVLCGSAGFVCGLEAIKVAAPHIAKHSKTIAVLVIPCIERFQASLTGSFAQTPQVSKAVNTTGVSIGPMRLHCVTAHQVETDKVKTFVGVSHLRPGEVSKHVRLAATRRAWTRAPQRFEFQKRFRAVVPGDRNLISDLLDVGWFQTHPRQLTKCQRARQHSQERP